MKLIIKPAQYTGITEVPMNMNREFIGFDEQDRHHKKLFMQISGRSTVSNIVIESNNALVLYEKFDAVIDNHKLTGIIPLSNNGDLYYCSIDYFQII